MTPPRAVGPGAAPPRPAVAAGLRQPDGWEVQVYRGDDEICAVLPAAAVEAALGPSPDTAAVRAWIVAQSAAIRRAVLARADGAPAAAPFAGLRIRGVVSCR